MTQPQTLEPVTFTEYDSWDALPWKGYLEPQDRSWIVYVDHTGAGSLWTQRDPSGAVGGSSGVSLSPGVVALVFGIIPQEKETSK